MPYVDVPVIDISTLRHPSNSTDITQFQIDSCYSITFLLVISDHDSPNKITISTCFEIVLDNIAFRGTEYIRVKTLCIFIPQRLRATGQTYKDRWPDDE